MKQKQKFSGCLSLVLSVLLVMASLTGCGAEKPGEEVPVLLDPAGIMMATTEVERGDILIMQELNVVVVPYTEKLFFEPINGENYGQVAEILAVPGQMVKEGDVLVRLDGESLETAITDLERAIGYMEYQFDCALEQLAQEAEIARIEYAQAEEDAQAAEKAYQDAAVPTDNENTETTVPEESAETEDGTNENSPEEEAGESANTDALLEAWTAADYQRQLMEVRVRQAEAAYAQLSREQNEERQSSYARLTQLRESRAALELTAPFDGRIIELYLYENQWVGAYETVMIMADESRMIIQGDPYNNASIIGAKQIEAVIDQVSYRVEYQEYDADDYLKRKLNGEELPSRFVLSEEETKPLSYGQSGVIRIVMNESRNTLLLPLACVAGDGVGAFVYTETEGQRMKTYVSLGLKNATMVEILDGLEEGDTVYVGD